MPLRDPIDLILRNAFLLQRISNTIARDSSGILRRLFDDIVAEMAKIDPTAVRATRYRRDRVQRLIETVARLSRQAHLADFRMQRSVLARLGAQQGEVAGLTLRATLGPFEGRINPGPTEAMMRAISDTNPFRGETLRGWANVREAALVRRVRQQVQLGMAAEESIDDMVRRIRGRFVGGRFSGGVMETTTREATALVRTAVTEVANRAAFETYSANPRVSRMYQYVATLDSRTTPICQAIDGEMFAYDDPAAPRPAQHFQCRSIIVPVVDWEALGLNPPEEGTRAARDPVTGKSIQVPASQTYDDWLRNAPASVQDDILGTGRARLFREGRLTVSDMVRADGSTVPLRDLRPGGAIRDLSASGPNVAADATRDTVLPAVRAAEKKLVAHRHEVAQAWRAADGEQYIFGRDFRGRGGRDHYTSGSSTKIDIPSHEYANLADHIVTHNHPSSAPFSPEDIISAAHTNVYELRAAGALNTFSIRRPAAGWNVAAMEEAVAQFRVRWHDHRLYGRGGTRQVAHQLWKEILEPLGVRYEVYGGYGG